jgi:hypothetical protein
MKPSLEWMPGTPGKGFMLDSGQVVVWSVDFEGVPWHSQRSEEMTGSRHSYHSPITIAPNGDCASSNALAERATSPDGREAEVAASHPKLALVPPEQFTHTAPESYGHAQRLLERVAQKGTPEQIANMPQSAQKAFATPPHKETALPMSIVLGTRTWRGVPDIEELGEELCKLLPVTSKPHSFRRRECAYINGRGQTVWGHDRLTVTFVLAEGATLKVAAERELELFLQAHAQRANPQADLVFFQYGLVPPDVDAACQQSYLDSIARQRAEEEALEPTEEERRLALSALEQLRLPDRERTFSCERDIAEASGIDRDRLWRVLDALGAEGQVTYAGFETRIGNKGGWWRLHEHSFAALAA